VTPHFNSRVVGKQEVMQIGMCGWVPTSRVVFTDEVKSRLPLQPEWPGAQKMLRGSPLLGSCSWTTLP
jgi:hypothetical protein